MESSGKTDTIQVLVDQSYIQMRDYSHKIWVPSKDSVRTYNHTNGWVYELKNGGLYESRSYKQNLIMDKSFRLLHKMPKLHNLEKC